MLFRKKDFVSIKDVTADEILSILETADTMKHVLGQRNKQVPYLQGKTVAILFFEKSARAKLSYQLAAQYLSATAVDITVTETDKASENIKEMGKTFEQMGADFIICRHPASGSARFLSERVNASVINAGDGINENPSQALLDLMTIYTLKGGFKGLKVAIIGDVAGSRVARSSIWGLLNLGAEVCIAAPPTLIPTELDKFGVKIFYDAAEAVENADVIMTLKLQPEKFYGSKLASYNEYKNFFLLDLKTLSIAKKDAIVMHPGSPNMGIEISRDVLSSRRCVIDDQITNGVAVRMAILYLLNVGRSAAL